MFFLNNMLFSFLQITISSVNCCSLNMSTVTSANQKLKIYGITKLKTDFILMSDIRLGSKNNGSNNLP